MRDAPGGPPTAAVRVEPAGISPAPPVPAQPRLDAGAAETWRTIGAAVFFAVLTVVLALPYSLHPASTVLVDAPDTHLYIWTLAWDAHAFLAQPLSIFDANIYYPNHGTLAYSENLIGSGLLAAPVIWLTGNLVLALNLVQLASTALCGLGGYVLGRKAGLSPLSSLVAGVVFLAAPPRFMRMGQMHLCAVQWVPFGLAFLHGYLDTGRRRDLRLALAFFTLQAFTSGHGAVFLGVAMAALVIYRTCLGEPIDAARRLRDVGITGVLLLTPLAFLYAPYRAAQREVGLVRSLENWLPTPESYVASPSRLHTWLRGFVMDPHVNDRANAWLFPGILVLLLAAVAVATATQRPGGTWREHLRRHAGLFYALLAVLAVCFFLPPPVSLWPHVYDLPGLNFIRVPSRFMILAMLGLGVSAGAGLDRLLQGRSGATRRVVGVAVLALMLGEYASMPFESVPYRVDIPAVDRWLDTQPKPFAIAEVPVPSPGKLGPHERHHTMAMLHATAHWQKTVHGYSGIRTPFHEQLYVDLNGFPDEPSLQRLRDLDVKYVVVHDALTEPDRRDEIAERYRRFAPRLRLEHQDGADRVYSIVPRNSGS